MRAQVRLRRLPSHQVPVGCISSGSSWLHQASDPPLSRCLRVSVPFSSGVLATRRRTARFRGLTRPSSAAPLGSLRSRAPLEGARDGKCGGGGFCCHRDNGLAGRNLVLAFPASRREAGRATSDLGGGTLGRWLVSPTPSVEVASTPPSCSDPAGLVDELTQARLWRADQP